MPEQDEKTMQELEDERLKKLGISAQRIKELQAITDEISGGKFKTATSAAIYLLEEKNLTKEELALTVVAMISRGNEYQDAYFKLRSAFAIAQESQIKIDK